MSGADGAIHPLAVVEAGARLGAGVTVGPFCVVGSDVALGDGVRLVSNVVVAGRTTIGARTRIFPFASIGHEPQDLKYRGEPSTLTIGQDCLIREGVTMNPGTAAGGLATTVGDRSTFLANAHVAHDCRVGSDVILSNNVMLAGHCRVGDFAILGGGAAVHQFARIGEHAFIGGLAGVENDVIPYGMALGNRAYLAGLNLIGLKRRGFTREQIHELRRAYRLIFAPEGTLKERIEDVATEFSGHPEVQEILDFIRGGGDRAVCLPRETKDGAGLSAAAEADGPLRLFLVAGEHSGDQLGFKLMRALREASNRPVVFMGVGGERMTAEGLSSLFPMTEIAVMGLLPVIRRLPLLMRRIADTARAIIAAKPDALVIIDSPDFTHRVAKRVRRALPGLPVIDYVSPSVWAWRTGRARAMRAYVDHVLALLPFEPAAHARLGGPACSYVGHPLVERMAEFRPDSGEARRRLEAPPVIVVLPGSRRSEIARLTADFGAALHLVEAQCGPLEIVLPAVEHLAGEIEAAVAGWPVKPTIVRGEANKLAAFRKARAALAASGTVTLELALAGVPMVVAYKVTALEMRLRFLIKVPSIVLANLIAGGRDIPEFLGPACTPEALAAALVPLVQNGAPRHAQEAAFGRLQNAMRLPQDEAPSHAAATAILRHFSVAVP